MPRRRAAVLLLGLLAAPSVAQKSPDETVKSMTVADGLQIELFAAEPMLINPTSIDVDHRGRVWVCEAVNYRRVGFKRPILREAGDRIVILTDKDGDGKADDSSVFYQGKDLYAPLGVCVLAQPKASPERKRGESEWAYRVLVCQSPDILEFWDKDGDGKADGPPSKFLTNFGGFDHDHGVHGITIGPDGKLYFTVGDAGVKGLQSKDGKGRKWESNTTDVRAGTVWRCDMDGTNLELIAHNFRNNYEACVNSFGEVWLSDNDDDGNQQTRICFVMPGGNYGYHPRGPGQSHWHEEQPGVVHKAMRTGFGSPTGICFYEGTLLPKKYHGQLLHTDAGPRELRAFHIKPKGAGYELTQENLVTSTDTWFRLSDVCVAPDGSLMLADWYDPGVGGHGMGDWTRGRIYRVTPKGHKGYKVPAVTIDDMTGTLTALASPNLAVRHMAMAKMRTLSAADVNAWTHKIGMGGAEHPKEIHANGAVAARFLWQYVRFLKVDAPDKATREAAEALLFLLLWPDEGINNPLWVRMLADGGLFQHPARYDLKLQNRLGRPRPGPAVAREWLIALRDLPAPEAEEVFYSLAEHYDGQDHFYRAALNIACGTDPKRREAILADFDRHFPEWNDKVADLVWELRPASVLPRISKLLDDPKLTPAQKGRLVDILAVNDDPAAGSTMLTLLGREVAPEIKGRALDNLRLFIPTRWGGLTKTAEFNKVVDGLLKESASKVPGLQLIAAAGATDRVAAVGELAADRKAETDVRKEAVRTLSRLRSTDSVNYLSGVMNERNDPLAPDAAAGLGALVTGAGNDPVSKAALERLQKKLTKNDREPIDLVQAILSSLAGTRAGTQWLLQQKESGKMREELVADAGRLLRNSPFQGERNKALLLFPAPGKLDPKKLPAAAVLAKRTGDAQRGEQVMAASLKGEAQCLRCHMVRGVGGSIGPDLSMIGKKASKENLFESLLLPSKAIADQHVQWKVDTLDGKSVTGLLVTENESSLTLRDANGKDHTFAVKDLDGPKQKSLVSIMPDNLVAALTEDELIDLVEHLLTLKTASLSPESWAIVGPFPNDERDSALDKDLGLEKLPAVDTAKPLDGKDGPVKWATVRTSATGYVDLMAHHAGKSPHSASYLFKTIESPADQDGVILFGNDDGAKVWVNGEKVFENRDHLAATPGRHRVPVKLKKGANAVLIKIVNGNDPHGYYFALTSEQELKAGK